MSTFYLHFGHCSNTIMLIIFIDVYGFSVCYLCRYQVVYREDAIYENLKKKIEQINEGLCKNELGVSANKIVHPFIIVMKEFITNKFQTLTMQI